MKGITLNQEEIQKLQAEGKVRIIRLIQPQPVYDRYSYFTIISRGKENSDVWNFNCGSHPNLCPYGRVGDRLWVREALRRKRNDPSMGADYITYVSDFTPVLNPNPYQQGVILFRPTWQWQRDTLPSIFMPRWASRYTVEVMEVKVEQTEAWNWGLELEIKK